MKIALYIDDLNTVTNHEKTGVDANTETSFTKYSDNSSSPEYWRVLSPLSGEKETRHF
jgi:hypothetical protein